MNLQDVKKLMIEEVERFKIITGRDLVAEGWTFGFNNRKTSLGLCNYTKKMVQLSKHYSQINTLEMNRETIRHELAHCITLGDDHGNEWKRVCEMIGSTGKVEADEEDSNSLDPSYVVVDTTCNEIVQAYHRKPSIDFSTRYIQFRKKETLGKLKVMKFEAYLELKEK